MQIDYFEQPTPRQKPLFSILIPTWNNLHFVKLCVRSIQQNSTYAHQIILHINDGSDGTLQWAKESGLDFTYSRQNMGICMACNAAYSLAKADYILYMNDDMYACPEWDKHLYQAVVDYGRKDFYFSSTQIDRFEGRWKAISSGHDYGDGVEAFREEALLKEYASCAIPDWQGSSIPPSLMHRHYWDLIGGFSIELSPGIYSDPDMSRKLWAAGVRNFRGVGNSLVYHFVSKSLHKVPHNDGRTQFLAKWGITARVFYDYYLRFYADGRALDYRGQTTAPEVPFWVKAKTFLSKFKIIKAKDGLV
ncbi:MAG: glycosyltransferase family 2 protein [Spirosomaceae bacterium]|nr:glycosyltransferase family 2 protein [Spirosomataceae bacterium]